MSETRKHLPFWGEFLTALLITLGLLGQVIYDLTEEPMILTLTLASIVILIPGILWFCIRERGLGSKSRIEIRRYLGFFLLFLSLFMTEWIWVKLCITLLGAGLILYDIASKRDLLIADSEAHEIASET
jgi:hypothetical protein